MTSAAVSSAGRGGRAPHARINWVSDLIRLEILVWERVNERLRERHDLSLSFFESLYSISREPGGSMRVGDLAASLGLTVGGTSKLADRIEAAGFVARGPDPDDRRAARMSLTPLGKRRLTAAVETYETTVDELLDPVLDAAEQRRMHEYVTRLLDATRAAGDR